MSDSTTPDPNKQPDLDDLLSALSPTAAVNKPKDSLDEVYTPASISEFLDLDAQYTKSINQIDKSIANAQIMLEEASNMAQQVGDPEYLDSYASITKSLADLFKSRSALITEYHKVSNSNKQKDKEMVFKREMEIMKIEAKANAALNAGEGGGNTYVQNNFTLKATTEDIFDSMYGSDEEKSRAQEKIKLANEIKEAQIISN